MPTRIRLQRRGKKKSAFYHIVIADGRAPRDGKSIEKIGTYNPITNPAEIKINFDKALGWLENGAQPTNTVRTILSHEGILHKHHLNKGVKKGALTQEQADAKFKVWMEEKENKKLSSNDSIKNAIIEEGKARLSKEKEINEKRTDAIKKRKDDKRAEVEAKAKAAVEQAKADLEAKADSEEKKTEE